MNKQLLVFVFLTLLATAVAPLFGQVAWVQGPLEIRVALTNETVAPEGLEVTNSTIPRNGGSSVDATSRLSKLLFQDCFAARLF